MLHGSSSVDESDGFVRRQTKEAQQIGQLSINQGCNCRAQVLSVELFRPCRKFVLEKMRNNSTLRSQSMSMRVVSGNCKQIFTLQLVRAPAGCLMLAECTLNVPWKQNAPIGWHVEGLIASLKGWLAEAGCLMLARTCNLTVRKQQHALIC